METHTLYRSQVAQTNNRQHPDILTYGHAYGFWLEACEELSSEIDPIKVHVYPSRDFKPFSRHHLEVNHKSVQCRENQQV